jgi:hypothetical protein
VFTHGDQPFGFALMPEEAQKEIERVQTRQQMQSHDSNNRLRAMLEKLDADDLVTLRGVIGNIESGGTLALGYYIGRISELIDQKFDSAEMCSVCGFAHAPELPEGIHPEQLELPVEPVDPPKSGKGISLLDAEMKAYSVEPTGEGTRVRCTGQCNGHQEWVSLEDRKHRPMELGCPACENKAMFG